MDYIQSIQAYAPASEQESADQNAILEFIARNHDDVLLRKNKIAHITSSGFIVNPARDKILLVHHNIRNTWAWTGGHMDGDTDLLAVALKETKEESGAENIWPLFEHVASLDVLPVFGHRKNGAYVSAHLHLSVGFVLVCDDAEPLAPRPGENTAVAWFEPAFISPQNFNSVDCDLYTKLYQRALCAI